MSLLHYRARTGYIQPPCDLPDDCEYCQALMIPNNTDSIAAVDDLFARTRRGESVTIGTHTYTGMYRNTDSVD